MSTTYDTVKAALAAHTGLAGLVGARIYADFAPDNVALPYVVYARVDLNIDRGLDKTILSRNDTFNVLSWAATRTQSVNVAEQVLLALDAADLPPERGEADDIDPVNRDRVVVWTLDVYY